MNPQDDARRFAAAIIRECGDQALNVVEQRIRLLESEQRHLVAQLWREVADAIKRLQGGNESAGE